MTESEKRVRAIEVLNYFLGSYAWTSDEEEDLGYALELIIKEPQPRVMTPADMYGFDVGYLEYKDDPAIYPVLIANGGPDEGHIITLVRKDAFELLLSCDDKDWRLWTALPTEEQREAVKWDD